MACVDEIPPIVNFDECSPVWLFGKIVKVYLGMIGQPLASFAELASRVDNESTAITAIRVLEVEGDMPAPTRTSISRFRGKKQQSPGEYAVNIDIEDLSDENYAFMQGTQTGRSFAMWYEDSNGYLYGDLQGLPSSISLELIIPRGDTEPQLISGQINWKQKTAPKRTVSPLYIPEGVTTTTTAAA
jgi:hypothetical protein